MTTIKQRGSCTIDKCTQASLALCHHCNQNICVRHLQEHSDLLVQSTNNYAHQINEIVETLNTFSIENVKVEALEKLKLWKTNMISEIERTYLTMVSMTDTLSHEIDVELKHFKKTRIERIEQIRQMIKRVQTNNSTNEIETEHIRLQLQPLLEDIKSLKCGIIVKPCWNKNPLAQQSISRVCDDNCFGTAMSSEHPDKPKNRSSNLTTPPVGDGQPPLSRNVSNDDRQPLVQLNPKPPDARAPQGITFNHTQRTVDIPDDTWLPDVPYQVRGRVTCENEELYALEAAKPLSGYTGLCPICQRRHVPLSPSRGFYATNRALYDKLVSVQKSK
ncbi:unnamed protein product [Didymodactylos carnosus]|uniref:Uncharacterized protein n=1 Tax=Didymodactylos carnosus TaxID=1234261 RepID=A0A8S2FR80_9BILA|nr:unnamed protein product [Didymodactylos carnosus]CAF4313160.1 unnamed protein product [Didymodactylos carnosus]